jgi:hypothetical protein
MAMDITWRRRALALKSGSLYTSAGTTCSSIHDALLRHHNKNEVIMHLL